MNSAWGLDSIGGRVRLELPTFDRRWLRLETVEPSSSRMLAILVCLALIVGRLLRWGADADADEGGGRLALVVLSSTLAT